jgi:hypothetical protein
MNTKKGRHHAIAAREKIKAFKLMDRLQKNAFGQLAEPLTLGQIRSIEILLRKCVPDLSQMQVESFQTHRYVVEIPAPLERSEWLKKYNGSSIPKTEETAEPLRLEDLR